MKHHPQSECSTPPVNPAANGAYKRSMFLSHKTSSAFDSQNNESVILRENRGALNLSNLSVAE